MAKFPKLVLTDAGKQMFVASQGGASLTFTSMKLGDGTLTDGEDIKALNNLKNVLLTANIIEKDITSVKGQCKLTSIINNKDVQTGFFAKELGVYAKINDGEEQLYAYTNAGNYADYIPDMNTPIDENEIIITFVIGNATNVTAIIDSSVVYATIDAVEKYIETHNDDTNSHEKLFAEKLNKSGDTATGLLQLAQTLITNLSTNIPADDNSGKLVPSAWVQNLLAALATNTAVTWDGDNFSCPALDIHGLMAQNGYISCGKLFGGFILQWGNNTLSAKSGTFNFPTSFNIRCNQMTCNDAGSGAYSLGVSPLSKSQFTLFQQSLNTTSFRFIAVGY